MEVASIALVVAAMGVTFGWQPAAEDPQAYEVLMQVEPDLVDVIHSGRQIPIESQVPANIAPIRNIRLVFGTETLPRTAVATPTQADKPTERIVLGQEPNPTKWTANFQSDDGWSGDRYSSSATSESRQFDQRGPTIGVEPIRTAQASPWAFDATQQSATNAANAVRDSVNSGIQQANQQLSQGSQQVLESTQTSSREFGQQLQNMTGLGGQPTASAATSTGGSSRSTWPAPPPLATSPPSVQTPQAAPTVNRTTTPEAWSSIQPQLAPPRLRTPALPSSPRIASNSTLSSGPSFPSPPLSTSSAPPLHSVLTDPATSSQSAANQEWASVWGTSGASRTAINDADASVGLEPVPPRVRASAPQAAAPVSADDPWGWADAPPTATPAQTEKRYNPPEAPAPVVKSNAAADAWANFGSPPAAAANNQPPERYSQQFSPPESVAALETRHQSVGQASPVAPATIGTTPQNNPAIQQQAQTSPGDEVPWKPLLGVSLALAASLGANFFLGISYADARQRYLSLVAKTTHAFQKEAGIAA